MPDNSDFSPVARPFTGRHMLVAMLVFFGVVIGVNALMAVLATQTWTGLVVKNGYVASQTFNDDLADAERQKALGWQSRLEYGAGRLLFVLSDRGRAPVVGRRVTATLRRPVHDRDDRVVVLTADAAGYSVRMDLAPGVWEVDVRVTGTDLRGYRQIFRINVAPQDRT